MATKQLFFSARGRVLALCLGVFALWAAVGCKDPNSQPLPPVVHSIWVLNEGQWGEGNASISTYDPAARTASEDIFAAANGGARLGDIPTTAVWYKDRVFVSLSASGKVYILDPATGKLLDKITGLDSPRYILMVSDTKGYISHVNKSEITVFNPTTLAVTGSIAVETPAEQLVRLGDYVYANLWSYGKKIAKIDPSTDKVDALLEVGIQPKNLLADARGMLWAMCDGGYGEGSEVPSLVKIDPAGAMSVVKRWQFSASAAFSLKLTRDHAGEWLYYLAGSAGIYRMSVDATDVPTAVFVGLPDGVSGFYGIGVNPENGEVYASDAVDWTQRGTVYRYSAAGKLEDQFKVGVAPADFYFL